MVNSRSSVQLKDRIRFVFGIIKKLMKDEDIAEIAMMWIGIIGVLLGASIIGLVISIVEGIIKQF